MANGILCRKPDPMRAFGCENWAAKKMLADTETRWSERVRATLMMMTLNKRFYTVDFCAFCNFARCIALDLCAKRYNDTSAGVRRTEGWKQRRRQKLWWRWSGSKDIGQGDDCWQQLQPLFVAYNQLVSFYCQRRHRTAPTTQSPVHTVFQDIFQF